MCHAAVGVEYWNLIEASEKEAAARAQAAAKAAKEQWDREAPARAQAARDAADRAAQAARHISERAARAAATKRNEAISDTFRVV
jgi:hypothetical protein